MPYATGFHQAAITDATRIAQTTMLRDVQTQVMASASVRQDTVKARTVQKADRSQRQRERFSKQARDGEAAAAERLPDERPSGRILDRLA